MTQQKTYNVTKLTPKQRRALFAECVNQAGFRAFVKNQNEKQTHYAFRYGS
jgi:hypothetical protein